METIPSRAGVPLKNVVRTLLAEGALEEVAALALERKRVLGILVAITFDSDPQMGWRAIEAMGLAGEQLAAIRPSYVKDHVRKLYWLITEESGGVFWRAPECMAELGARLPKLLRNFVPIAFHLIETLENEDLEHFRPGALWAVGRLADTAPQDLPDVLPLVLKALGHSDPQTRGMAVWCLGRAGEGKRLAEWPELIEDDGPVSLYRNRILESTTVGALAREILAG